MNDRFRSWLRCPVFLTGLAAALIALVVQSGDVDSADTVRRLHIAEALSYRRQEPRSMLAA